MKLSRLVSREIAHRKGNFALSLFGVALAVACVVATICLLGAHQQHTVSILDQMKSDTEADMAKLEDEIRKSMKGLGFNIYIFPKGQEMAEVYAEGFASKTMPEEYVTTLANSEIVTVNHLLPTLTRKLKWTEQNDRTVIVIGIRGEVPIAHRGPNQKKPLLFPVEKGKLILGYELAKGTGLQAGDKTEFLEREFEIEKTHAERGTKDDITIWMNLEEAQEMLELPGQINAIQALECNCATIDRLGEIRAELMEILPETHIIETQSTALARAEARNLAKATAQKKLADTQRELQNLGEERERFAGILLPLATVAAMIWIGLLALMNVRERVSEIGILRAVGVKSGKIFSAFLTRAGLAGLIGAVLGLAGFAAVYPILSDRLFQDQPLAGLMTTQYWIVPLIAAPVLAALA
ncbi:MAG: ABC transporter permease, partial [Verrucomicrobiales bacterium]|nr:ABC transporter permease [Verrucomicrobiales bacterium]